MSVASQVNTYRPIGVLLGGSFAAQRSIEPKPVVCALLRGWKRLATRPVTCTRPTRIPSFLRPRSAIMVDRYRKKIAAMVIQLAKDDPKFVKEMIQKLKR